MNQKQLISSIKELKEIKPRKEWALLLKSTLLEDKVPGRMTGAIPAQKVGFWDLFENWKLVIGNSRRLAYAFAVVLLFAIGAFGFVKLLPEKVPQQTASLTHSTSSGQAGLKQNVVALNNLAQTVKNHKTADSSTIKNISANAKALAQNLKNNPTQDSATLKDITSSLKTLADVSGTDLTVNPDVQDLYQTVVLSQIADLQKTTLTADQQKELAQAEVLSGQGNYSAALEKIWTLTNTPTSNSTSLTGTTSPTNK